jgi:hypothetical protein
MDARKKREIQKLHDALDRLHHFLNTAVRRDDDGNRIDEPFVVDLGFELQFGGLQSAFVYFALMNLVADVNLCFVNATTNLDLAPFPTDANRSVESFVNHLDYLQHECKENAESLRSVHVPNGSYTIDIDQQVSDYVSTFHTFGVIRNYTDALVNQTMDGDVVEEMMMEAAHIRSSVVSPLNPQRDTTKSILRSVTHVFMDNETDSIESLYRIYNSERSLLPQPVTVTPNASSHTVVVITNPAGSAGSAGSEGSEGSEGSAGSAAAASPENGVLLPTLNPQVLERTFHDPRPSVHLHSLQGHVQLIKKIKDRERQLPHTPASSSATQAIYVVLSSLLTSFVERRMKKVRKDLEFEMILPTKPGNELSVIKNFKKVPLGKLDEFAEVILGLDPDDRLMSVFKLYEEVAEGGKPLMDPGVLPELLKLVDVLDGESLYWTSMVLTLLNYYEIRVPISEKLARKLKDARII